MALSLMNDLQVYGLDNFYYNRSKKQLNHSKKVSKANYLKGIHDEKK